MAASRRSWAVFAAVSVKITPGMCLGGCGKGKCEVRGGICSMRLCYSAVAGWTADVADDRRGAIYPRHLISVLHYRLCGRRKAEIRGSSFLRMTVLGAG